ncbi:MAG: hypothetical protein EA425_14270 [Puniceicoccaceae bacterium]|nr:MAG: hypothetical protein EA425_14270 [Puniceicoccaceae bacterium]
MSKDEWWGKTFYFWGEDYYHPDRPDRNTSWGQEDHVDGQFQKMADKFVSRGISVILGEFTAIKRPGRPDLTDADFDLHVASRTFFHKYVVDAANSRGLKPVYWDIAGLMFDWTTGAVLDPDNLVALTGGPALPPPAVSTDTSVSVASIEVIAVNTGQGRRRGQATVTVVNNRGEPVADATVTGDFTGTINQSGVSAVTNESGVAVLQTSGDARGRLTVTFCVSGVAKADLTYNASANVATCANN